MRIADELRQQILDGTLAPGEPIPTLAEIQKTYKVAEGTAFQATRVLANEGLTDTKPGAPTMVRDRPRVIELVRSWYRESGTASPWHADMAGRGRAVAKGAHSGNETATPAIAERLAIDAGAQLMRTVYVYEVDGRPAYVCKSWEAEELTRDSPVAVPETGPLGDKRLIERMEALGFKITRFVEAPVARSLSEEEAEHLRSRPGIVAQVLERICYAGDRPVETADFVVSPEFQPRYEFPVGD
jgi:GntR family transcriptional regulator